MPHHMKQPLLTTAVQYLEMLDPAFAAVDNSYFSASSCRLAVVKPAFTQLLNKTLNHPWRSREG